jgi:glycosyltransferase involved in cell wall biosynthesis
MAIRNFESPSPSAGLPCHGEYLVESPDVYCINLGDAVRKRRRQSSSDRLSITSFHIVHIVDSLDRGGLEQVVCDLSTEQLRQRHQVSVFCLHNPGTLAAELEATGVRVICGYKRRGPDLRVMRQLRRLVQGSGRALFHSHSMMPNYYGCAARILSGLSIPIVNTRHDMGSTRPGDRREKLYRLSVPLTRLAVMVSESVRDRFVAAGVVPARKARVILNGIHTDCSHSAQPVSRAAARRLLAAGDDQFVAGCVGRLVDLKNHASAIRVIARLAPSMPQLRLMLIGDGPLRRDLPALARELGISDRVLLLGERANIRELLPGLDAFLMPSLTEGHSIALLEAMAAGLSIIATRVGGNSEVIHHEHTGMLVPVDDDEALSSALRRLVDHPALARRLGADARSWVLRHVSVRSMADAYESVYAEALGIATMRAPESPTR